MKMENGYVVTEEERPYAEIINSGAMLQAVKEYREATGVGLKEAKDYIDGFRSEGVQECRSVDGLTPNPSPKGEGSSCNPSSLISHP